MPGGLMDFATYAPEPAMTGRASAAAAHSGTGWFWTPRTLPGDYPYDLDGSERFMRPRRGWDRMSDPYQQMLAMGGHHSMGWVADLHRQDNRSVIAAATGRYPWGPTIGVTPGGELILSPTWTADGLGSPMDLEEVALNIPHNLG